jgi:uncharacterized membrane protein
LRTVGFVLLFTIAIVSALVTSRYLVFGDSAMTGLLEESLSQRRPTFYLHLVLGMVAMLAGPVQFFGQRGNASMVRSGAPRSHPWLGRVYVLSCLAIGATGLHLGVYAFGGFAARLGFVVLSTLLIASTAIGWRAVRAGNIRSHVEWMTRSYALILSFVTIRFWQFVLPGGTSEPEVYAAAAWLSFVPNLIAAELWCRRRRIRLANMSPAGGHGESSRT